MKKFFLAVFSFVFLFAAMPRIVLPAIVSYAAEPQYARVISENAVLYRTDGGSADIENKYFTLPKDYYVFLQDVSDSRLYKVNYDVFTGYVKAEDVDIVSYTPKLKYASGQTLKIELVESPYCYFREFPSVTAQMLGSGIPDGTENIKFYNHVAAGTDKWYFIEYGGLNGYVRADLTVITREIAVNDGAAEPEPELPRGGETQTPKPLDTLTVVILIAVIGIPAIALLLLLFKPRRRRPAGGRREANRVPRYLDDEEQN